MVRGITVDQWQGCYRNDETATTSKVTISFSSEKWLAASGSVVPVEVRVEAKKDSSDKVDLDVFTVTQFRPSLTLQEEGYFVK
jgi:hypothetical protein